MPDAARCQLDVLIFGGGAAGLWLLDDLRRAGRRALLLEANDLGSGQTIASQGIIHGGLKYTLSGLLSPSAAAISEMPLIWRRCLAGQAEPDLSATRVRSGHCYVWRTQSLRSRLGMMGARAGLRITPRMLAPEERPAVLAACPGPVAQLDEQVIDPASFLADLADRNRERLLKIDASAGLAFDTAGPGEVRAVRLRSPDDEALTVELVPRVVVFTAGGGTAALREAVGLDAGAMQRRPLHMVVARGELPELHGHCVDGATTRVTITTAHDRAGRRVWQIGGRVAEDGVNMPPTELIAHANAEVQAVLPGADLSGVQWATYVVDRAEGRTKGARRPEDVTATREGNVITAWPTKLALAPRLAETVRRMIDAPTDVTGEVARDDRTTAAVPAAWPRPEVAQPPWETIEQWSNVHSAAPASR